MTYSDTKKRSHPKPESGQIGAEDKQPFSFRSHEIARINRFITNQLDFNALRGSAFELYEFRSWKNGSNERAVRPFGTGVWEPEFRSG